MNSRKRRASADLNAPAASACGGDVADVPGAAVDEPEGLLQLADRLARDPAAPEPDQVEARHLVALGGHDEGGDVQGDPGKPPDDGALADPGELVVGRPAAEDGVVADGHMAGDEHGVGDDDVVANDRVVGDMRAGHQQAVAIPRPCGRPSRSTG